MTNQRHLSLRYETKGLWQTLQHHIGVNETGAAMVLDLFREDDWVSYSRTSRHYDQPHRYRSWLYTYRKVVGQADFLDRLGLIDHARQLPGVRGWQSAMRATDELRQIASDLVGDKPLLLARPNEPIVLKNFDREKIDYRDTDCTRRMRRKVERINEAIIGIGSSVTPNVAAPVRRIFNGNFHRGGRFYAIGSSWQNIKAEARKAIMIDGEPTVELDFGCLHGALLYAEAGAPVLADCYALDGWPRDLVKPAFLTLINAPTIHKARYAIASEYAKPEPLSKDALRTADQLISELKRLHTPIASAFHSDAGARLMAIDAGIAEGVMLDMIRQGIVALPVHDSFLVQASKRNQLEAAMMKAAHKAGLTTVQVAAK